MTVAYVNGEFLPEADARIGVLDFGFQLGIGLFETMRTYNGRFFRLRAHLDRLLASVAELRMVFDLRVELLESAVRETVSRNRLSAARVRLTVTPGQRSTSGPASLDPGDRASPPPATVVVTASPLDPYPPELYRRGLAVVIAGVRQNQTDPLSRHKTLGYFPRMLALEAARRANAGEALFFNTHNHLACGAISNVLLFEGPTLITPGREAGPLPGITRGVVLELARKAGIPVEERPVITIDTLLAAREVFLTNSIMELLPVTRIEKHTVGDGRPGPRTLELLELYRRAVEDETTPAEPAERAGAEPPHSPTPSPPGTEPDHTCSKRSTG